MRLHRGNLFYYDCATRQVCNCMSLSHYSDGTKYRFSGRLMWSKYRFGRPMWVRLLTCSQFANLLQRFRASFHPTLILFLCLFLLLILLLFLTNENPKKIWTGSWVDLSSVEICSLVSDRDARRNILLWNISKIHEIFKYLQWRH